MKKILMILATLIAIALLACKENKTNETENTADKQETEQTEAATEEQGEEKPPAILELVGKEAPDFTLDDIDGKSLKLSSLRGKHVVVDFWGSWCVWCLFGMPEMKNYYDKYNDKLEMVSIDCGDTEEDWKNAVKDLEMTWKNVINDEKNDVSELYKIEGFPTKIIINPEGKILKAYVGEDPEFYSYLDKIFEKDAK